MGSLNKVYGQACHKSCIGWASLFGCSTTSCYQLYTIIPLSFYARGRDKTFTVIKAKMLQGFSTLNMNPFPCLFPRPELQRLLLSKTSGKLPIEI